jgi:hypothetical protein
VEHRSVTEKEAEVIVIHPHNGNVGRKRGVLQNGINASTQ